MQHEPEYYTIDLSTAQTEGDIHKTLHKTLAFPEPCGDNWNAFWDFLTDMVGVPLYIDLLGLEHMQREFPQEMQCMIECFKDLKHIYDDRYTDITHITIVTGDTRTEIT